MNKAVARLRAVEAPSGLAEHTYAVARSDEVAEVELEAVPQPREALEETADLLLPLRIHSLGQDGRRVPADVLRKGRHHGRDVAAAECFVGAAEQLDVVLWHLSSS